MECTLSRGRRTRAGKVTLSTNDGYEVRVKLDEQYEEHEFPGHYFTECVVPSGSDETPAVEPVDCTNVPTDILRKFEGGDMEALVGHGVTVQPVEREEYDDLPEAPRFHGTVTEVMQPGEHDFHAWPGASVHKVEFDDGDVLWLPMQEKEFSVDCNDGVHMEVVPTPRPTPPTLPTPRPTRRPTAPTAQPTPSPPTPTPTDVGSTKCCKTSGICKQAGSDRFTVYRETRKSSVATDFVQIDYFCYHRMAKSVFSSCVSYSGMIPIPGSIVDDDMCTREWMDNDIRRKIRAGRKSSARAGDWLGPAVFEVEEEKDVDGVYTDVKREVACSPGSKTCDGGDECGLVKSSSDWTRRERSCSIV